MSVIVLAEFTVQQGKLDQVLKHLQTLTKYAQDKEPGTKVYVPTQDPENDHNIKIWEEYESKDAFDHHRAQPPFQTLVSEVDDLVEGGMKGLKITQLTKIKIN